MHTLIKYFVVLLCSGGVTLLLTPVIRKAAWVFGLLAVPGGRRTHEKKTPLTGGLAVFAGMHLACVYIFYGSSWGDLEGHMNLHRWLLLLSLSSVLLLLGVLDDKLELRPNVKLLGQLAVAVAAYFSGVHIGTFLGFRLYPVIDLGLTVVWFLGFINAFNLIDGMDGLATGLGAIAATGMAAIFVYRGYPSNTLVMLALVGSCLAFLRFNFYPASIFLGDSGSMFIGFTLAFVALVTNSKSTTIAAIGIPMLAIGVPVLDTLLAIWRRSVRSRLKRGDSSVKISTGDHDHLHHRLARRGLTQRKVVLGLYVLNFAFVLVGISLTVFKSHYLGILLISFVAGTYVLVRHLAYVEFRDSGALLSSGMDKPISRVVAVLLYIPLDVIIMMTLSFVAVVVTHSHTGFAWGRLKHIWVRQLPLSAGIPFLVLCLGRTYRTVWSRARITEYARLAVELLAGIMVAFGLYSFFDSGDVRTHFFTMIIYAALLIPSLIVLRALWRVGNDMATWLNRWDNAGVELEKVVVIGADKQCVLYLRSLSGSRKSSGEQGQVVAILDDDANLHRRYVHGIKVYGGLNMLRELIRKDGISRVVVTSELDDDKMAELLAVAGQEHVTVRRSKIVLEEIC